MTTTVSPTDAARSLRELTATEAAVSERDRTLTPRTVEALWDSGLMQLFNPSEAGGAEPSFAEMIETWIELAWQDGSLGWVGIANFPSAAACAAYLPPTGFDEVFTAHDNRVTVGGQFFPNGMGESVDGGYRVTGAWNFGSGTGHAEYVAAGFMPTVDGELVVGDDGIPPLLVAVIPREEIVFTDGWHVQGLKGTGSYDYNVTDVFVPESRTFELFTHTPAAGPFRRVPDGAHAHHRGRARVVGARRGQEHARRRRRTGHDQGAHGRRRRPGQPDHVPEGTLPPHGHVEGGPPATSSTPSPGPSAMSPTGGELTPSMRADLRMAATYATEASREVVQWAHLAAGTSAIREGSRLERAFRDLYTGTQHVFIGEKTYTDAARIHLGLIDDQFGL